MPSQFEVPAADVDSVQVTDEDLEDPELAAEMAAMMGGDDDEQGEDSPAPAPAPAPAPRRRAAVSGEALESAVKDLQAKIMEHAMAGEAPPPELLEQMKVAKQRLEDFQQGGGQDDIAALLSDPFYPGLIESNEVLAAEEKELTEKTMSFAMQVTPLLTAC